MNQAEATLAGIDPRKMSRLWQSMYKHGTIDKVMFAPEGRDLIDARHDKEGRIIKRIYPVMQFRPYPLEEYLCIVVDVGTGQDGVTFARAILLNPYDEDISTKVWLDDDAYLDLLLRTERVFRGSRGDAVVRVHGRIAVIRKDSYPPTLDADNEILLIERMYTNEFVVVPRNRTAGEKLTLSGSNALAVMGQKYGITSQASAETLKFVKVEARPGQRAPNISSDAGLDFFVNRYTVMTALGNKKFMGNLETLSPDATVKQIRNAARELTMSIHPDRRMDPTKQHKFLQERSVFGVKLTAGGTVEGGPYIFRREVEFMLSFLRELIEKAEAHADSLDRPADTSALPKEREPSSSKRKRNRRRGNGVQAPASASTTAPAVGETAGNDAWDELAGAQAPMAPEMVNVEGVGTVEVVDAGSPATDASTEALAKVDAPTADAGTEAAQAAEGTTADAGTDSSGSDATATEVDPAVAKFQARLQKKQEPKAKAAKPKEERQVLKGLGALATLAGKPASED